MLTDASALSQAARLPRVAPSRAIPLLCLLAFLLIGLSLITTRAYPGAFDELEHISYAAFLQETGRLLPKFEEQRTLAVDDMGRWTARPNYLPHPSPFYVFVSLFLDRTLAPAQAILPPRLASAGLLLLGVALALWAGWRHFGQDRAALLTFCLLLALCPKLLAVASQVTNDSLAVLGGALAYWGASTEERRRRIGLVGIALGLTLALWAKPNAGLAVGAWLGVFALLRPAHRPALLLALAAALAVGTLPSLLIIKDYGALVPVTVEQFGHVRQLGSFSSYLPAFLLTIGLHVVVRADRRMADPEHGRSRRLAAVLGDDRVRGHWRLPRPAPPLDGEWRYRGRGAAGICPDTADPPLVRGDQARLQPAGSLVPLLPAAVATPGPFARLRGRVSSPRRGRGSPSPRSASPPSAWAGSLLDRALFTPARRCHRAAASARRARARRRPRCSRPGRPCARTGPGAPGP